jgi:hypothetical protein
MASESTPSSSQQPIIQLEESINVPPVGSRLKLKKDSSQIGTLRYFGPTEFASGLWCGMKIK